MTVEQLDKISAQRLEDVDIDTLVEVNSIKYADGMPVEKKVAGMIAKTGNPYFRRSGKSKIKISFSDNGESLKDNCYACQCIEQSAKIRGGNSDGFVISLQTNKDI